MPLNIPGLLVPFQLLLHPRLVLPNIVVKVYAQKDIRQLDFLALHRAGYRGAVFDKDNCLTVPYNDKLVPELRDAWLQCRETFGQENILVVSNSAGTTQDTGGIQSESVTYHLGVPVLLHGTPKPGYSCIKSIRNYFASLRTPIRDDELVIVGDRIFTDVVLANRIRLSSVSQARRGTQKRFGFLETAFSCAYEKDGTMMTEKETLAASRGGSLDPRTGEPRGEDEIPRGPLAVWTTGIWERESMAMRYFERTLVDLVQRWSKQPLRGSIGNKFVKVEAKAEKPKKDGLFEEVISRLRSG